MTVAAVILAATPEGAIADTLGQPRARRLVDLAWSGGALPVVVVAADPDGALRTALAGSEAIQESPAAAAHGPAGQMAHGADRARAEVLDTTAILLWPARFAWVGPETITSLIEAHGTDPDMVLRPAWDGTAGWPVLFPIRHLDALRTIDPDAMPDAIVDGLASTVGGRTIDLGDPGAVYDVDTPFAELPAYLGPPDPPAGHTHEWGEDVAAEADLADE